MIEPWTDPVDVTISYETPEDMVNEVSITRTLLPSAIVEILAVMDREAQ